MAAFPFHELDETFASGARSLHPPDQSYLVAVSGGRDSVALLDFLHRHDYGNLTAVHVHHGLRNEEADNDAAFVLEICRDYGIPCRVTRVDTASQAREEGVSLEEAARELRYREFARAACELACPRVFLAHHADDQVETILFRFFRGCGARGLSGMLPFSRRTIDGVALEVLRPWLGVAGEAIATYVAEHGLAFREDSSNRENFSLRNRIRHRLLPVIGAVFERDVRGAVWRAGELARQDEDYFSARLPSLANPSENGLDVTSLRTLEPAVRDRVLLHWLRESGVPDVGFREIEGLVSLVLSSSRPAKMNLPGDVHARRRQGLLFLEFPDDNDSTKG